MRTKRYKPGKWEEIAQPQDLAAEPVEQTPEEKERLLLHYYRKLLNAMIFQAVDDVSNETVYAQYSNARDADMNITTAAHFLRSTFFPKLCEAMPIKLPAQAIIAEAFKPRKNNLTDRKKPTTSKPVTSKP
jgi:hypothetical protein